MYVLHLHRVMSQPPAEVPSGQEEIPIEEGTSGDDDGSGGEEEHDSDVEVDLSQVISKPAKTGRALVAPVKEKEGQSAPVWKSAVQAHQTEFEAVGKVLDVDLLKIDTHMNMGQTCTLDIEHAKAIEVSFQFRPPLGMLSALVYNDGSMSLSTVHVPPLSCSLLR